ncbi:hypothetical protein GALMADRAFT_1307739 [Galerina marginata CBS 339.88]|uniref:GH18 domain-containing protein n=1 Tax=Galerina marginata (strain CBS 339.88) TaxID=685588 RepID=A0A067T774_GALM3|nr:hypothetical protein GALMADRAFT_1307739 [Galerina marginata CBS 339.88]
MLSMFAAMMTDDTKSSGVILRFVFTLKQFVALKEVLCTPFALPPKRIIGTLFSPSGWINDGLINERKRGLQKYLTFLIHDMVLSHHTEFLLFLGAGDLPTHKSTIWPSLVLPEMTSKELMIAKNSTLLEPERTLKPVAASYYPSWASDAIPPHKIDFSKFDILFFAFVTPNGTAGIDWDSGSQETLKALVSSAHSSGHETKIVLSMGGWSGSHWYSEAMSSASNRSKLVKTLADTIKSYGLDGIDIDWEYPNASGAGNPHSSADSANFLSFLKLLRSTIGDSKVISAAVTHTPWLGENGAPLINVSEYAKYMTYVNIMNYDVFSSSSHPGPNAPLGNLCGSSSQPQANAQAALAQWTRAGMPAAKLLLGLPVYGYVSKSKDKELTGSSLPSSILPTGAHPRLAPNRFRISEALGDLSALWGQQIPFIQLVQSKVLVKNQDGTYGAANGYTSAWDNCSDTPYLYNIGRTTVVTFDDTYSIASKTLFAKKSGMGGCFTWSLDQDDGLTLHNIMLHNLGR